MVLLLLSFMLFAGIYQPLRAAFRARILCEFRPESLLSRVLTGRILAVFKSTLFVSTTVPILAWLALTVAPVEIPVFIMLSLTAGSLSLWMRRHLNRPFARLWGVTLGSNVAAFIFIPILAWIYWSVIPHSDMIRSASLTEVISHRMQDLPQRRGMIAEILAPLYALDTFKVWLVVQLGSSWWIPLVFSLEAALVSFVVSRASAALTNFIQSIHEGIDQ